MNRKFSSVAEEATFCEINDDNEESQSLISPKHQFLPAKTKFITDEECDLPDSQPLFTEVEENIDKAKERIDMTRKRKNDINILKNEESQSLATSLSTSRINEANSSASTKHSNDSGTEAPEAKSTKFSNQKETKTNTESDSNSQNGDGISSEKFCVDCIFEKELDKRNYYFGNLLIGELQFLPPCMRSEAYVTILKYVDSLKQQHRKRHT